MDHKRWLSEVPPARRVELTERRDGPAAIHMAMQLGLIALFGVLIFHGVPFWPVLLLPQAILLICLFHFAHEATHGTPFKTPMLNQLFGHIAGFLLFMPFHWFVPFHLAHHKWTNIPGKDPELGSAKPESLRAWLWHVSGLPVWWKLAKVNFRLALSREHAEYLSERARLKAGWEARVMLVGYAIALGLMVWQPALIWVWIVPILIGQPFLRVYLLAEHGDLPFVSDMFDNTRTTFTNGLVRWLTWNMPYHTEHHVWPNVPFHKLPALHQDMRAALRHTEPSYARFTRRYLARRLQPFAPTATSDQKE